MAQHSVAQIKRKNGSTITITVYDMMKVRANEWYFKECIRKAERLIGDLEQWKGTVEQQIKELVGMWDDTHTRPILNEMATCAEELDETIKKYTEAKDDLILLVRVAEGVNEWLQNNPDYNHIWKDGEGRYKYYCKKTKNGIGQTKFHTKTVEFRE